MISRKLNSHGPILQHGVVARRDALRMGFMLAAAALPDALFAQGAVYAVRGLKDPLSLLKRLSAIVIGRPAAFDEVADGLAKFVLLGAAHGVANVTTEDISALAAVLDDRAGPTGFSRAAPERQRAIIGQIDAAAYSAASPDLAGWVAVKRLILAAYYTSEAGASEDLRYDLVPGRYDLDEVPPGGGVAWANDWFGVFFP